MQSDFLRLIALGIIWSVFAAIVLAIVIATRGLGIGEGLFAIVLAGITYAATEKIMERPGSARKDESSEEKAKRHAYSHNESGDISALLALLDESERAELRQRARDRLMDSYSDGELPLDVLLDDEAHTARRPQ